MTIMRGAMIRRCDLMTAIGQLKLGQINDEVNSRIRAGLSKTVEKIVLHNFTGKRS